MSAAPPPGGPLGRPEHDPTPEAATRRLTPQHAGPHRAPPPGYPPPGYPPPGSPPPGHQPPPGHPPPTAAYPAGPGYPPGPVGPPGYPFLPPAAPPVAQPRKSRTGLVVGLVGGLVGLAVVVLVVVLVLRPGSVSRADLEGHLTGLGSQLAQPPRSASCPGDLTFTIDQRIDCTLELADGTEVPGRIIVRGTDGGDDDLAVEAAVVPKKQLDELLSADVNQQYKAIAMTCATDLAGKQGATTDCVGTDADGSPLNVRTTFAELRDDLSVKPAFTPFLKADQVAALVTQLYAQSGITATVTCEKEVLGKVGESTSCRATGGNGATQDTTATVARVLRGYLPHFEVAAVN